MGPASLCEGGSALTRDMFCVPQSPHDPFGSICSSVFVVAQMFLFRNELICKTLRRPALFSAAQLSSMNEPLCCRCFLLNCDFVFCYHPVTYLLLFRGLSFSLYGADNYGDDVGHSLTDIY